MIEVYLGKAFSSDPALGNLAGVVFDLDGTIPVPAMQQIAKEIGAVETAFLSPSQNGAHVRLRWFTPNTEVGMCIHATVASMGVLKLLADKGISTMIRPEEKLHVETKNEILEVHVTSETVMVGVKGYNVLSESFSKTLASELLTLPVESLINNGRIVQIGSDKELIIEVAGLRDLSSLTPTVEGYTFLCKQAGVSGISLFCRDTYDSNGDIHLREFAPLYGYLEDPLCGTAAGAIFTALNASGENRKTLLVEQGHFVGTSGIIKVSSADAGVWVGGEYALVGQRTISL